MSDNINDLIIIVNDNDVGALITKRFLKENKIFYEYEFNKGGEICTQISELPINTVVLVNAIRYNNVKTQYDLIKKKGLKSEKRKLYNLQRKIS